MKRQLVKYRNSAFGSWVNRNQKYAPILFFIGGFVFDTLTLGRIDRTYDLTVLCFHMTALTVTLYLFNTTKGFKSRRSLIVKFSNYFPLAIQFFFGALSSAYVIYFSRSVSLSGTMTFFVLLLLLLVANEFLKKRISNIYLQFGVYHFLSFTFFAFMIPVFLRKMGTVIFLLSGVTSFAITVILVLFINKSYAGSGKEFKAKRLIALIVFINLSVNALYFFRLIPPVPLAMKTGLAAHDIQKENDKYLVSYETKDWFKFWRNHNYIYTRQSEGPVYVFSSIFAPTELNTEVFHRWKYYDNIGDKWLTQDDIGFEITGGRIGGYRGYTYKNNIWNGEWKVELITSEELTLGVVNFEIIDGSNNQSPKLIKRRF